MKVKYLWEIKSYPNTQYKDSVGGEEEEEEEEEVDTYTEELRSEGKPSLGSISTACFLSSLIFL